MSQGAGVTSAAAPPSSSIATTAAPLTSPTSVTIPQWKYDLLQRRKTNNCPKTIGAQHNHHQQNSLTQLKHGNNTCVSECSEGRDDRVTTKTSSPTHAHAADTVIMTMIKSPTHEHKQLVGHGNNNDEKQFQLQSNNEPNLSHFQFQPHSKNTAFNENNRKLFKKSCEVASFGGTNTVTGTTAVSLSSGAAVSSTTNNSAKSKKMVAVQEISDTITKELDTTFDSSEEFQYGPGIVSKLRYRYLTLTLRQNAQKQRANLDSLRRATSLNNLLDHDEEELDEEAEDDKKMMLQHNQHQQQQNKEKQQITCQQQKPNAATTTTKVANNKFMKQNQHSSVHFSSSVEQQQQRTARQIKRGNDTLKRARSVEALLCDNNNKSCNNNNNNRNSWNDSKSLMQGNSNNNNSGSVTIEDKIHNARERNLLSLDKVPKRLTSIIDDTERPPPDLVKQTLKMFEATANRRGGPNRKANGEVAAKIATFKSIISQEKPIIIYPKPSSPKKSPLKLKIDNMVRKFTSTTPTSEEQPDIIPRKSSDESPTQSTSSVASPSPISELTKKIHNLSIIQTTNTTTIHNSNSVSEQNSCESDDLYDDDDQEEVHDDDDHDENIGEKVETIPETVEPLSVKRISKSALDNIAKAGTAQHFSFKTTTSSPLSTPPTKQIGVIRPIVAATNKEEEKLPLTSREIQKNMINDKKREEAAISNNNNSGTSSSSSTSPAWMSAIKKSNGSGGGGGGSKNHHQDNNTMVFNFKDRKEVPDYIENDGLLFRKRREMPKPNESGFVLLSDTCLDTSTDTDEMWQQMGPPSPCDVEFINANIIIDGKSSIRNRSTKELHYRVQFNDSLTSTFEYPSESSIMEEGDTVDYNGDIMNEDTSQYSNTGKMLGNLSLGSLGSYTPLKAQYQDKFELGVTRTQKTLPPPTQSATNNTAKNSPSTETVNEQDLDCLKPANDEDTVAYSEGVLKTDILF